MVLKISPAAGPDLNWPLVRSAGRIGKPKSSFSPAAFSPSPLPVWPWHSQHLALSQMSLPCVTSACDGAGGGGMYNGAPGGCSVNHACVSDGSERSTASSYLMY